MGDALLKTQVIAAMFRHTDGNTLKKTSKTGLMRADDCPESYIAQVAQARSPGFIPCDYQHSPSPSSIFTS